MNMEITLTEEEVAVLKRAIYRRSMHPNMLNAVYVSPAQELRNRANEIEQEERDVPLLQGIIRKLDALPND